MAFELTGLLVLFHVWFAALWFGGAVYQVRIVGGTLRAAGPAAGGFVTTLMNRGGIGKYFAVVGGLTLLFGGWLYGKEKIYEAPFDMTGGYLWLTLGAILAVLAYLHGMAFNMSTERKMMAFIKGLKGPPTPEQGKTMMEFGMKLGKNGAVSTLLIGLAMLLMLMHQVLV